MISLFKNPYLNMCCAGYILYKIYIQSDFLELFVWAFYTISGLFILRALAWDSVERDKIQAVMIHMNFWDTVLHDYFDDEND